jgi:hypothetical protein
VSTTALSVPYFDCNTFVGRSFGNRNVGGKNVAAGDLVAELDRLGVARAAVYHVLAKEHHPSVGNRMLLEELGGHPRLAPVWVVMPAHTGEMPESGELVRGMLAAGIRLARIFPAWSPQAHRYSLAEWCVGELLGALEDARVPLECDFTLFRRGEPPWRDIHEMCESHPRLPMILIDIQGRNNRTLYALLRRFPNLYVHTAGLNVHQGLEDVCRRFGPERLVYGSAYPVKYMGGAVLHLERNGLGVDDRRLIASGNIERLLAGAVAAEVTGRAG